MGLRIILILLINGLKDLKDISIVLVFVFYFFSVVGHQAFRGLFLSSCYNINMGYYLDLKDPNNVCETNTDCWNLSTYNFSSSFSKQLVCRKGVINPNGNATNFDDVYHSFIIVIQIITMQGGTDIFLLLIKTFTFIHWVLVRIVVIIYYNLVIIFGNLIIFTYLAVFKQSFVKHQNNVSLFKPLVKFRFEIGLLL